MVYYTILYYGISDKARLSGLQVEWHILVVMHAVLSNPSRAAEKLKGFHRPYSTACLLPRSLSDKNHDEPGVGCDGANGPDIVENGNDHVHLRSLRSHLKKGRGQWVGLAICCASTTAL